MINDEVRFRAKGRKEKFQINIDKLRANQEVEDEMSASNMGDSAVNRSRNDSTVRNKKLLKSNDYFSMMIQTLNRPSSPQPSLLQSGLSISSKIFSTFKKGENTSKSNANDMDSVRKSVGTPSSFSAFLRQAAKSGAEGARSPADSNPRSPANSVGRSPDSDRGKKDDDELSSRDNEKEAAKSDTNEAQFQQGGQGSSVGESSKEQVKAKSKALPKLFVKTTFKKEGEENGESSESQKSFTEVSKQVVGRASLMSRFKQEALIENETNDAKPEAEAKNDEEPQNANTKSSPKNNTPTNVEAWKHETSPSTNDINPKFAKAKAAAEALASWEAQRKHLLSDYQHKVVAYFIIESAITLSQSLLLGRTSSRRDRNDS